MATRSPSARTMSWLEEAGWIPWVVERWIPFGGKGGIRKDLYGCIDILGIRPYVTVGVQATTFSNRGSRWKKMVAEPLMRHWLKAGNGLWLVTWKPKVDLPIVDHIKIEDLESQKGEADEPDVD